MSILRKYLIENLRKTYNNVGYTYGYETKSKRIANRLEKDHSVDARCIFGNFSAEPDGIYLYKKESEASCICVGKIVASY